MRSSDILQKGILNLNDIEGNIKFLNFYIEEENKKVNRIYQKLLECNRNYNTSYNSLFLEAINIIPVNIRLIKEKRMRYTATLANVIVKYNNLAKNTTQLFVQGDDNYE